MMYHWHLTISFIDRFRSVCANYTYCWMNERISPHWRGGSKSRSWCNISDIDGLENGWPELSAYRKWFQPGRDIKCGDVVLVISPNMARENWPLGKLLKIYLGKYGQVQKAKVQAGQGTMTRSIMKLSFGTRILNTVLYMLKQIKKRDLHP